MNTLYNSFHNTEYRTRKTDSELEAIAYRLYSGTASKSDRAYVRRVHNALCGADDCTCGDEFGRRH